MRVPFLDFGAIHTGIQQELIDSTQRVIDSGFYVLGQEVSAFEEQFASYCGVTYCIGVANGLDALRILLDAYEIGPGDEVVVPTNTFIATWLAVSQTGATIVPVEPNYVTRNIDHHNLRNVITEKTRAIIPVHLYGLPAEMDEINAIAQEFGLVVIEDAAQAQGAKYFGKRTCSLGNAAATSFYPGKNLGALGDGGAILTSDDEIATRCRYIRNYGSSVKYKHDYLGCNSRLDEIQAAFLSVKLKCLDDFNSKRVQIADRYSAGINSPLVFKPENPAGFESVYHLYVICTDRRDELEQYLRAKGVGTLVHYPIPPHKQLCYSSMNQMAFPVAERLSSTVLSLPIFPGMTSDQIDYVIESVNGFYGN